MKNGRVLLSAYACEPGLGSEAGIGWNWTRQVAQQYDTWLITRENNVEQIERAAREEGIDNLTVVGFDLPPWARFWKRGALGAMPYFYLWQVAMGGAARKLDAQFDFDVVHHLTFASSWIPSGLATLDKPFVWGPVGQHPRIPDRFLLREDWRARALEFFKAGLRGTLMACDPLVRRTRMEADRILSLGSEFSDRVQGATRHKLQPCLACGTDPHHLSESRFLRSKEFRVLYAGRLVDLKGVRLVIESFARLVERKPEAQLDLLGEGPRRAWIEQRVKELGLEHAITLHGKVTHDRTLDCMHRSDVFLFPSFEGAGMVVPEAMAAGNPVVCLDFGGPGEMVGSERGLRVQVAESPEATAAGLASALLLLADNEEQRERLARSAANWASTETTWAAKGELLPQIYGQALAHHQARKS
ncbi:MAG: glycosyltransferase involved in cell wall biosynthesis [Candidatus Paceibacteria bacterium]